MTLLTAKQVILNPILCSYWFYKTGHVIILDDPIEYPSVYRKNKRIRHWSEQRDIRIMKLHTALCTFTDGDKNGGYWGENYSHVLMTILLKYGKHLENTCIAELDL